MGFFEGIKNFFFPQEEADPRELPGRNDLCWCGSGKKYKKCHIEADEKKQRQKYAMNCGKS